MNSRFLYLMWLTLALACGSVLADDAIRWAPDIAQARQASAQFKVPLLVHFYGDHCLPCMTLEQRVLNQKEVVEALNKYFICVRVNASQDRRTAAEFQVHSWPTDVFVSPDGKTLYQGVCLQDVRGYIGVLENVAVMNRDRNVKLAATINAPAADAIAQQTSPVGNGSMRAPDLPLPGANMRTNSQTPSFYTASTGSSQQQLPVSTGPARGVQTGPLIDSAQPSGITGSTPGQSQQLAAPAAPDFNTTPNGQLPPRIQPTAQIASPADAQGVASQLVGYPQVPANNPPQATVPSRFTASLGKESVVANRYYEQRDTTLPVAPPAAVPEPVVAHQTAPLTSAQLTPLTEATLDAPAGSVPSRGDVMGQPVSFQPRLPTKIGPAEMTPAVPGVGGYCPIALKKAGAWVEGNPQFAVKHRGKLYWLSSEQARQDFLQSPDAATPVLSGYDPMVFLSEGRLVEGNINFGLHEEIGGSVLFFESEESKKEFAQDYSTNSKALNVILRSAGIR